MFGMVYIDIVFWIWYLGGAFCILGGKYDNVDSEFDILEDISPFGVGIW